MHMTYMVPCYFIMKKHEKIINRLFLQLNG